MKKLNALQIKKNTVAKFNSNNRSNSKTPPTESAYSLLSETV